MKKGDSTEARLGWTKRLENELSSKKSKAKRRVKDGLTKQQRRVERRIRERAELKAKMGVEKLKELKELGVYPDAHSRVD
jgi:hypothetical protein